MADDTKQPKTQAEKTKGAGTSDPAAPGGINFDVNNASAEDFARHEEILRRRAIVANLSPIDSGHLVSLTDAPAVAQPTPTGDIKAVKDGETRYFNQLTWDAMETKGEHDGWQVAIEEPAEIR